MTTAVIVQARMGSTRLPGKVMLDLDGMPVLAHVLNRCHQIRNADVAVCAISDQPASDPIEVLARKCDAIVYRGSEDDVLARHLGAAQSVNADIVVRITSDCPLIDPEICDRVVELRSEKGADYATNNMPRTFPHGVDCEVFTFDVLAQASTVARGSEDRQHVTPWMRTAPYLKRANLASGDLALARHRWTLDYPEDLAYMRALFAALPSGCPGRLADILHLLEQHPEITEINAARRQMAQAG
jgi:spore coat polysaccharide biosynthesis protein SpsF